MRTRLYKFIFIVISLCALATTNAWANKIVYLDVTNAPVHSNLEYTTDMYIYYWVPGSDTKKYYQLVPKDSYQMVNNRKVYRIVLGNNANTSDEWWWRVCRKNPDGGYHHYHKEIRYNQYNWYRIQNEMWVYDESNDSGTSAKDKDGIAYRTPGLLTGGHIYFDNARTKWIGVIQFVVGHGSEMHTYTLTKINDTELYYLNLTEALTTRGDSWGINHTYYSFIANTSAWKDTMSLHPEGVNQSDVGFSENYRRQGELLDGKVYFIRPKKESGNWLFDIYQTVPKYTIYQRAMIRPTGGSYAAVENGVNYPASVNISLIDTIYGSTQETVSKTYNSGTNKNYNPRVLIAGKIVHTYKSLNSAAYTFDGWGSEPSTTGEPTLTAPSTANAEHTHYISENTTVCAFFTAKQFTVTLDNQNATTAGTTSVTPSYGYVMPTITPPTRTGYTFGGYWTNSGGQYYNQEGGAYYNKKWDQTANTTLYAKWTANKYTVKFNGNSNTSGSMSDQSFTYDVAQNLTANAFSRTGYTFAGWNTKRDGTGTLYSDGESVINLNSTSDGQITLYAQWTANKYTITLNANGGSGNTASVQATYASATLTPTITNPTRTGYTFAGWYSAVSGGVMVINTNGQLQANRSGITNTSGQWIATTDKTLYAQWTANANTPYVVKHYQQNLDGTYPSTPTNTDNLTGTTAASITPSVKSYDGFTSPSKQTVTIAANGSTVVEYRYTRNSYKLTWNLAGGTISNAGTAAGAVKFGATLTAPTVTRTGYTFKSWSPVPSTMPASDATYTAQWTCVAPTNVNISGNYILFPGETIELTVSGNNIAADATYVWKKGDQVIPGQTTATLTIPNCVAANAGNYSCTVTNGTCSASNDFTIKIYRLRGLTDSGWTTDFVFTKAEGNTAVLYLDLVENTYEFKLNDGTYWYWNEGTMTYDNCTNWVIEQQGVNTQGKTNTKLSTSISGLYIFTLDYTEAAKPKLSVTYPSKKVVYLKPNIWGNNAKYTIYSWNSNGGNGIFTPMEIADCEGNVYKAEIDAAHNWVSFIRAENYANGWDGLWNRSKDLMLVEETQFKITDWKNEGTEGFQAAEKWTEKSNGEWEPYTPYYTISYDMNTNEVEPMENVCLMDGSAWTAPTDPERIGYTFLGWKRPAITNDLTLYKTGTSSFIPTSNEQLTAQWQLNEYTVTWKVDGKDYVTNIVSVENALLSLPPNPADDALGCCADKFMGWSTSANPNESDVFDAKVHDELPSITQNTTFHAVFATKAPGVGSSSVTFRDMGYEDKQTVESITLGDGQGSGDATIILARGASLRNYPKYYIIGNALRAYAGNIITINATYPNTVIRKVTFTFGDGDGTNEITANSGTYVDGIWTENVESPTNNLILTIGGSTGHRRIASIEVTVGINGNEYINYVTTCPNLGTPTLGDVSIDKHQIDVRCNTISSMKSAAKITFPKAADLTCPITVTASDGFLISTDQNASAKYASSLTIYPKKSDLNKGTIAKTVYVRADATQQTEPYSGTITILKTEGDEETKSISITANVNCQSYVLNTVDHLGSIISTTENFANDIIANAPNAPEPDACSTSYTFAGWSMTEVAYGSPSFTPVTFPFVMPAEDVTLYPVYICNSDYHRVTSDLGANNWAGDYLIAASSQKVADGSTSDLETINGASIDENIVPASFGDNYYVSLIAVEGGYVLKTQDNSKNSKPYIYITNAQSAATSRTATKSTAASYPLDVQFDSVSDIRIYNPLGLSGKAISYYESSKSFGFYKQDPIYLYKKYLYTSSLICEEITAEDAMVTSSAGQTIKVNVTATMSNMTVDRERALTVESDNSDFTATIVPTTNANEYNVAVSYTPSAEDNTDGTETATITIKVNKNPVTTFQVTGRHLPANFVIAAKWGENWYALPANIASNSSKDGLLIEVNDPANPTKAIAAPHTTKYGLKSVYTSNSTRDRFSDYGERLVFVENISGQSETLYNGGGSGTSNTNIQVNAQYTGYYEANPDRYEWLPTTDDLKDYLLTSANAFLDENARTISLDVHGEFGTLLKDRSYNGNVRLLPVDNFYQPIELQIVEWKQNSVSVMYTGAGTHYITQVGDKIASGVLSESIIDHAVYRLSTTDLTTATNQPLTITIKDGETTIGAITITIPAIVVGEKNSTSLVTNNDIAKATSVVVLDGATLTADATKYTYDDMVVYPGGRLVINYGTELGMYTLTLRLGSSWGATEYEHKYPEFVLNTTVDDAYSNTSGKINLDYVTTKEQYYTFVAPFAVNTKTIKYPVDIYGSNVKANNTGSFEFQYYDGAARAAGNTGWTVVEEDPTNGANLVAGQGYTFLGMPKKVSVNGGPSTRQTYGIHRIPMSISATNVMKHENETQTVPVASNPSIKNNNSSWNLIGNPYMQQVNGLDNDAIQVGQLVHSIDVNGKWTGGWHWDDQVNGQRFLVFPSNDGLSYEAQQSKNALLPAFKNFFVQINNEAGTEMTIPNPNQQVQPALQAPAYHDGEALETDVEVAMVLEQDEKHTDQLDLLINKAYTADFDRDADFTKMMNATQLNLFGVHWDNLSFIAIDQQTAQQSIPIGYQVPDAGEYTLRMSDKPYLMWDKIEALYLTDHEMEPEVTTDIMQQPYLFHVGKAETNHTRFTLSIIRKAESENQTPTHIDTQVAERKWSCKFIYQNKIYILHDGVIYDMMGKQIRTINK